MFLTHIPIYPSISSTTPNCWPNLLIPLVKSLFLWSLWWLIGQNAYIYVCIIIFIIIVVIIILIYLFIYYYIYTYIHIYIYIPFIAGFGVTLYTLNSGH